MSNSFYWKPAQSNPLSVFGTIHIGMRRNGWAFHFKGYRFKGGAELFAEAYSGLMMKMHTPKVDLIATSWEEWKALLPKFSKKAPSFRSGMNCFFMY